MNEGRWGDESISLQACTDRSVLLHGVLYIGFSEGSLQTRR
jgi:hypothetical protein